MRSYMLKRTVFVIIINTFLIFMLFALLLSGCQPASNSPSQSQPIEIISVNGPLVGLLGLVNPGGPIVEITLKNVSDEPAISLTATLELYKSFEFIFDVTPSNPLLPGESISSKQILIQGGFSDTGSYPLAINATVQSGDEFVYTKQVQILPPAND